MAGRPGWASRHFVGRDRELAVIAENAESARRGHGGLIVVSGDAGIGKTALCEQAALRAEQDGFVVGWGRCWSDGGAPPLWPWPEVLAQLGLHDAAALLAEDAGGIGLDRDRFARFAAAGERLAHRSATDPMMIVVDDAHAADTAALLLARLLLRHIDRIPLVVLMARRRGDPEHQRVNRLLDALERDATIVPLASFDNHDTAALFAAWGLAAAEDYGLVPALTRLTGGNPLLLSRMITAATMSNTRTSVANVIGDALDVLGPEHRDVVALAGVLGMEGTRSELAALCGGDAADVHLALDAAAAAGLMDVDADGWAFTHDLVRQSGVGILTPTEVLEAHARAAVVVAADDRPAALARRAHHALVAATRSDADAEIAVACCREAAPVLARGLDNERAAALLDSAVVAVERLGTATSNVDLLLEWADALQVCGRLADARAAYERAAVAAHAALDPLARARACLGLGGVWVSEHRGRAERERILAMQRDALHGLPAGSGGLRARLVTRLAAEAVYDGAPVGPVLDALAAARQLGDPAVLAEALSLTHHAMLAPEHLDDRAPLADEQVDAALAAGDELRVLFGLLWKTVDLFLAGDARAERTLDELRHRADAVGCRSIGYVVAAIDVMRLIRSGRLDDAEVAAQHCYELGVEVGDADAEGYYGAHVLTIRWLQDRDGELLDLARDIATSSTLVEPEFAFRAATAAIAARAGRADVADAMMQPLRAVGLAALPRSSTWLSGMVNVVELAATFGDGDLARDAYHLIEPFAARPVMPSLAVTCAGSVDRALGLAALTWGDAELAVEHLHRAVTRNVELGNRPFTALARGDLAAALVRRDRPTDRRGAIGALEQAAEAAAQMGMTRRSAMWRQGADELAETAADPDAAVLRRDGQRWIVDAGGRYVVAPDLVGFTYLGELLAHPGREIVAAELCGGAAIDAAPHELVDRQTVDAYRSRVVELDSMIDGARRARRANRVAELERERHALRNELSSVLAVSGRSRPFVDDGERARTAVRKAITRAIDAIAASDEQLGAELRATIRTGRRCSYVPDVEHPRRWSVAIDG